MKARITPDVREPSYGFVPGGIVRKILPAVICVFLVDPAFADNLFLGENESGSGSLNVPGNWQQGLPDSTSIVQFNRSGDLTMTEGLEVEYIKVRNSDCVLNFDLGGNVLSVKEFFLGESSDDRNTFSVNAGSTLAFQASGHVYLGYQSVSNVFTVADGGMVTGAAGVRIGYQSPSRSYGNRLEVGKDAEVSFGNILLGDGASAEGGTTGNSLLVDGAKSLVLSGEINTLSVGHQSNATGNTAEILNTETVSLAGDIYVGAGSGATGNTAKILNAGTVSLAKGIYVGNGTGATGCSLAVSNVASMTVVGGIQAKNGAKVEIRDLDSMTIGADIQVGGGASLVLTDVAGLELGGKVTLGGSVAGTSGAHVEISPPEDYNRKNIVIDGDGLGTGFSLVYDGRGAGVESGTFDGLFDDKGGSNRRIELRNLDYTLTAVQRYRPGISRGDDGYYCNGITNRVYVIGKGTTLRTTFMDYSPFWIEGSPGTALVVDGGTIDFSGANGGINIGSGSFMGGGNILDVRNGGKIMLSANLLVGDNNGSMADDVTVNVLNGAELTCGKDFYVTTSGNRITVSNATLSVRTCKIPTENCVNWATNNTVFFRGDSPRFVATQNILSHSAVDDDGRSKTGLILDFELPPTVYPQPPMEAGSAVTFEGKTRLRIDAAAFEGTGWQTIIRVTGEDVANRITVADWDTFVSELPVNCRLRYKDDTCRELELKVYRPRGLQITVR